MPLPAPDLDDRRFQDLVDDAKRLVMRRCPDWTDHNVSDPGVTLIETFAYMTDQLLYRVNQVPDRVYLKFLDLIGLRMLPPTPARGPVTFWLSAPATAPLTIPAVTRVATLRTDLQDATVFSTQEDLPIVPCSLRRIRTPAAPSEDLEEQDTAPTADRTGRLTMGGSFAAFSDPPRVDDSMLLGLDEPVPRCAVRLNFQGRIQGVGVNPEHPPLSWEAWTGEDWTECEVSLDETGGLNRPGSIIIHIPAEHDASVIDGDRAGWIRARIIDPIEGQPPYTASPIVDRLDACTVGGTADTVHAEIVGQEVLGESEGVPGQCLPVSRAPILAGSGAPLVETSSDAGWQEWTQVEHFAESAATDHHFILDATCGLVLFGPGVRTPGGAMRQYGAVPPKGATIRISGYATGGGRRGNVAAHAIQTLRSSIPFVAGVENLHPAHGGVDGETLDEAKTRGPLLLRTRNRAVTAEDYEILARETAPEIARVRCISAGEADVPAGAVRVLVVPAAASERGRILFENLQPSSEVLARIAARLDDVRVIGTRVSVEPPLYRGITVVARVIARARVSVERVRNDSLDVLYRFLSPLAGGGPDGDGWPFGRPVQSGEIFGLLQRVHGVELVEDVRLFSADPVSGGRGKETTRIDVAAHSLVFSFEHQIRIEEH
jgi:predicted phage baseplate assembly protein